MPLTVAAAILAAGRSRRAGAGNKLLARLHGKPLVVHAAEAALAAGAEPVLVVIGHDGARVHAALADLPVGRVENPDYSAGMGRSLATAVAALPAEPAGLLVLLGDMPWVRSDHLEALSGAFRSSAGTAVCVPVHAGRRGNPVLWPRRLFGRLSALDGDEGARSLLQDAAAEPVHAVDIGDDGVLRDVDTAADIAILTAGGCPG